MMKLYLPLIRRTWLCLFVCVCVCVCVCVFVVELLLHFYPDRNQIWTPDRYGRGKFNEGVDWGSEVPGEPRGQNVKLSFMTTKPVLKNICMKLRMMVTFMEVKG